MNLHEKLIDELLNGNVTRTPREEAARNEILRLRGDKPKPQVEPLQEKLQEKEYGKGARAK